MTRHARNYLDVTQPWPVPDGFTDLVYADNVIEHIPPHAGSDAFVHAFRALTSGGVFGLATPDIEAVTRQHLEGGESAALGMERNREKGRHFVHRVQLIRLIQQVFVGAQHYLGFSYDYAALSTEMEAAGFEVNRRQPRNSEAAKMTGLEARTHPAERLTVLIVEGRKPPEAGRTHTRKRDE